jgi:23S rRNA (uracil1939-C5)-methyltransferase
MAIRKGPIVAEQEGPAPPAERTLNVSIEKMVYGGEGLARTSEGVLLVPWVVPGERAAVRIEERHKGVRRASVLEVFEPSTDRIAPACPYFSRCGGCHYQHIRYERQLEIKRQILAECFERIGKLPLQVPISVLASEPWQYRNRTRLRIGKDPACFEIGYFEPLSHRLCSIESCPISSPAINDVIGKLAGGLGARCFPEGTAEIELFGSDSGGALLATVYSPAAAPESFGDRLREAIPGLDSVCWREEISGSHSEKLGVKTTLWGSGSMVYRVGEFHYRVGHDSFFQTNRFLLPGLMDLVTGNLAGKRALDLYAGVGFLSLPLARRFEEVAAVESNRASARDLESNLGVVGARARALQIDAEKFLATASPDWDAIVADPPRSGLSRMVLEHLCRLRPRRLVYVSCDPTTLARDLVVLVRAGYRMKSVHLADLFPQTFHLETVVHLERAE